MSKSGGGGLGGGDKVAAGDMIPEVVRKTIQSIREITGKQHSDEDIHSVLKDCAMDPNETAQKLLYLDTFHEVKKRRDKKKEISGSQVQGRGTRSRRGNFSSKFVNSEVAGRNAVPQREIGVNHRKEGSSIMQKTANSAAVHRTKASSVIPNGPSNLPNGSSFHGHASQSLTGDSKITKDTSATELPDVLGSSSVHTLDSASESQDGMAPAGTPHIPTSSSPTASDLIVSLSVTQQPGAMTAIKSEVVKHHNTAEQNHIQRNPLDAGSELPMNEKAASRIVNSATTKKAVGKSSLFENNKSSELLKLSGSVNDGSSHNKPSCNDSHTLENLDIPVEVISSEDAQISPSSPSLPETSISNGHVIFPNHFKVPEALKSGLTFGSFGVDSGSEMTYGNGNGCVMNSTHVIEASNGTDETARETSSGNESESSSLQVDQFAQSESPQHMVDKIPQSVSNLTDPKVDQWSVVGDQSKQMELPTESNQIRPVQVVPNFGFGIVPTMQGGHLVQFEGHETQACDIRPSNFVNENSATSSPSPTPPLQNSVAASPQLVFRAPYPPNYVPYGPYFNPYLLPPMHPFLSHNGIPQQPSTGNAYLTSAANAPGVKFPLAQLKPGTSGGNLTPIGFPPVYGSYGSAPIGFNTVPTVTSGSSAGNDDLSASQTQLKESHIYTTGPLGEVSAWIPPPGQDISSLQPNSLYHLPPQGQHLTLSPAQSGHGPFPGIYPPMSAASTVNAFLQQSQPASGTVETGGPPTAAYQQPQLAHVNWNSSY